jgi:carbon dioxide concentrating mechanism protein CcmN
MYLPPLQAMHDPEIHVSGDVTIHPSAAIASGVLLQATPGSQIVIAAGVCIGMGAVLHSYEGTLAVQEGASLGAGVLMVGSGTIGANACVGASSTLLNCSVQPQALVPPGSMLGDRSRQIQLEPLPEGPSSQSSSSVLADPWATEAPSAAEKVVDQSLPQAQKNGSLATPPAPVHGQTYVNDLLSTLLPHRNQQLSPPP